MPRLGRTRYLSCFYCSRKTSKIYDGKIRKFDCPFCEATNYLDEDGQITDPPVATDREATPAKYAVSRTQSPPSSPTGAIFCAKCLKNQHLLRASLAQYLPDPDDPDYEKLEKDYYRFRNSQEKLYPQICAECEPKMRERLEQAAYTAKTDVLRRMIERSSTHRKHVTHRGWLDVFDVMGRWLWIVGLVLQFCWHVSVLKSLYLQSGKPAQVLGVLDILPRAERSIRWSILATVLSVWWNPRFMQVFRGFTRHINGVSRWYFYQALAVTMRILLPKTALTSNPDPKLFSMQLAGHIFAAGFALLIFALGPRSIRINMAPLFEPSRQPLLQPADPPRPTSGPRSDENKSITELLDEISNSPPSIPNPNRPPSPISDMHFLPPQPTRRVPPTQPSADLDLNALDLSSRPTAYDTEMDWSPTQSRHRAFNTQGQRPAAAGFNEAPTEPHRGSFWYKVPPAPTTPAQRVFNPPNQPRLRKSPATSQTGVITFRGGGLENHQQSQQQQQQVPEGEGYRGVDFRQPRFFPPPRESDPRNTLSDLFGEGLSLSQEERQKQIEGGSWWKGFISGGSGSGKKG